MDRYQMVNEIIGFVTAHKDSHASKIVVSRILGDKHAEVTPETIDELQHRLPRAAEEDLEACYYIIQ